MAVEWYYMIMGEEYGPVTSSALKELVANNTISRDTPVRNSPDSRWHSAEQIGGLFTAPPKTSSAESMEQHPSPSVRRDRKTKERSDNRQYEFYLYPGFLHGTFTVVGLLTLLFYWLVFDTTNEKVHNLGKLNDQIVGVIVGATFFIVGCAPTWGRSQPHREKKK